MSERAPKTPEIARNTPEIEISHEAKEAHKDKHEKSQESSPSDKNETLKHIRHEVERQYVAGKETKKNEPGKGQHQTTSPVINKELKDVMFARTINRVRAHLSAPDRTLSKVIHNKTVDKVSAVGEKTVARPYGLFGGGLLALLGGIFATYLSKHYGLHYNLLAFALFFAAGYLITTVLEIIFKVFRPAR